MRGSLFLMAAAIAVAQTPADVVEFFRATANALAEAHSKDRDFSSDAGPFLDRFDPNMPGFATLRDEIQALVSAGPVGSVIDFVSDDGDNQSRALELDWVLEIADQEPRRQILKCSIERRGKKWKITKLEPIEFFKPPPP
jgi:hypothetical protein